MRSFKILGPGLSENSAFALYKFNDKLSFWKNPILSHKSNFSRKNHCQPSLKEFKCKFKSNSFAPRNVFKLWKISNYWSRFGQFKARICFYRVFYICFKKASVSTSASVLFLLLMELSFEINPLQPGVPFP